MTAARPLRVGTPWLGYNERRNFAGLPVPGVEWVRVRDRYALLHALRMRLPGRRNERLRFRHGPPSVPGVHLLHFFNTVSSGSTPWVVTFETVVPRSGASPEQERRYLGSPACRRLIALSECARAFQLDRAEQVFGDASWIDAKTEVLHPPQPALVEDLSAKPDLREGPLRLAFVGRHFFRKGGRPLLDAFESLVAGGADVCLHLISTLESGDRWSRSGPRDEAAARATIERLGDRVALDEGAPHERVLDVLRESHVLLLPTLAETYGYSVLEGQAAGCATLTTNVRALPEINTPGTGWTIELPLQPRRGVRLGSVDELRDAEARIRDGIVSAVHEMLASPGEVQRRAAAALARIRSEHDPGRAAARLAEIYAAAVGR